MNKIKRFLKKLLKIGKTRFNLINGWRKGMGSKQSDKFAIKVRISKLTLIDLRIDFNKEFRLILFNIGLHFK